MKQTLEQLSAQQFGPQADAYVTSAVHASGADLDWLGASVGHRCECALIDVGCGGGHVTYRLAPQVQSVVACDPAAQMLHAVAANAAARGLANVRTVQAPAERLPFGEGTFDAAVTRFSAHHWGALECGLREVARVLKPNGSFWIIDAVAPGPALLDTHLQTVEALRDPSHVRDYSIAQWSGALTRAGFAIEELHAARVRIEFASWLERMQTPPVAAAAIRRMQQLAPQQTQRHFAIEPDGSFQLDTLWIRTRSSG